MSDMEEDYELYEATRQRNIAKMRAVMQKVLDATEEERSELSRLTAPKEEEEREKRARPRGSRTKAKDVKWQFVRKYETRNADRKLDYKEVEPEPAKKRYARAAKENASSMKFDGEESGEDAKPKKKKRIINMAKVVYDLDTVLSPDEITAEMLDNVANRSSEKEYDQIGGTTCHQCRQKTKDFKTVCRSGKCIGVRGQFCGPCLRGRYGESAVKVLKDPNWMCPVCRNICNCSICLRNTGKKPTGILVPTVLKKGYKSVKDYRKAKGEEIENDDEEYKED